MKEIKEEFNFEQGGIYTLKQIAKYENHRDRESNFSTEQLPDGTNTVRIDIIEPNRFIVLIETGDSGKLICSEIHLRNT